MKLTAHVDGGSRGNPGPAAIGVVIQFEDGRELLIGSVIGTATNNEAEYTALLICMRYVILSGQAGVLQVFSDSLLMVNQVNRKYDVHNDRLKVLYNQVCRLREKIPIFKINWVPREENQRADKLVNEALDEDKTTPRLEAAAKISGKSLSGELQDLLGC